MSCFVFVVSDTQTTLLLYWYDEETFALLTVLYVVHIGSSLRRSLTSLFNLHYTVSYITVRGIRCSFIHSSHSLMEANDLQQQQ